MPKDRSALIVVDVQGFYVAGVKGGEKIIPYVNSLLSAFDNIVVVCNSMHVPMLGCQPKDRWPHFSLKLDHRASFLHKNDCTAFAGHVYQWQKGHVYGGDARMNPKYSDADKLLPFLQSREIDQVFVCGIYTEYCVYATVMDALKNKLTTHLVLPACGHDKPDSVQRSVDNMRAAGAVIWTQDILDRLNEAVEHGCPPEIAGVKQEAVKENA